MRRSSTSLLFPKGAFRIYTIVQEGGYRFSLLFDRARNRRYNVKLERIWLVAPKETQSKGATSGATQGRIDSFRTEVSSG